MEQNLEMHLVSEMMALGELNIKNLNVIFVSLPDSVPRIILQSNGIRFSILDLATVRLFSLRISKNVI